MFVHKLVCYRELNWQGNWFLVVVFMISYEGIIMIDVNDEEGIRSNSIIIFLHDTRYLE